jgi:thiol:disulfide interchange protein/DsbC/DsbD-like thiol-disulfide interchange protein
MKTDSMKTIRRVLQLVMMIAVAAPVCAQIKALGDGTTASVEANHLTVELIPSPASFDPNKENIIGLHFKLEAGWHVYWANAGDAGEPPHVEWTLPKGITAGPLLFPAPKRLPVGPLMDFGYENDVILPVRLQVARSAKAGSLQAKVDWLVCREVCIPGKALLGLKYGVSSLAGIVNGPEYDALNAAMKLLPQPLPKGAAVGVNSSPGEFDVLLMTGARVDHAEFYSFDQNLIANAAPQEVHPTPHGVLIRVPKDSTLTQDPATIHGLIKVSDSEAYEFTVVPQKGMMQFSGPPAGDASAPADTSSSTSAGEVTALTAIGLAFLGGIILNLMPCVFPVLFLKGLALVQSSEEERSRRRKHGLVYTLGILVSFWVIVTVLLVLRASGAHLGWGFQLQSPVFVAVLCLGIFFFALSLAGMFDFGLSLTSAGNDLAQKPGYAGSFFTGVLATVVATPCTAPLMGAAIGFALGQAAWLTFVIFTAVALGLALPYLLLSFNPAWTKLLPKPGAWMEVLKEITSIPLFLTAVWLAWVFGKLESTGAMAVLIVALVVMVIIARVRGRWPAVWLSAVMVLIFAGCALAASLMHRGSTSLTWETYSADALAAARANGKPVFVDFTAAWCLSCHVNEAAVLDSAEVQDRFKSTGIVLMRADWTKYDPAITAELASVNRSGVPTYVIFPAGNKALDVLPELLSKGVVLDALTRDVK